MFKLENEELTVLIEEPEKVLPLTTRFDSTGYITDVILHHQAHFCASEPRSQKIPSTGGRGICSAYRFDAFDEVNVGEYAPRFGVGLLRKKTDAAFQNGECYECIPFAHEIEQVSDQEIRFRTIPRNCAGYAAETKRTIRIEKNCLVMEMQFFNTGEKAISFKEFCHNFLTMDGLALGPDYSLYLPQVKNLQECVTNGVFSDDFYDCHDQTLQVKSYSTGFAVFEIPRVNIASSEHFSWKLKHEDAGLRIEGRENYQPAEMCVWSKDHMFCPEINYQAKVEPGESCTWSRSWTFCDQE